MTDHSPALGVSARGPLTLDQLDELVRAYGFRPTIAGETVLTSERTLGTRTQIVSFQRRGAVGWQAALIVTVVREIAPDGTPQREAVATKESGMLLTLSGAQAFLARLD